ncbi:MarR family winged helix-turn-helix transcriptional regulator [Winogradskya humida]|uniref:MarR family transcriptional regulator n=1 Tax=Winogradskya humida TaxID=113566 RepID=A0ABQ3ZLD3_9ACTN|nr:MarR family transcriptional regulator [Actinoplanes humidus]GIE19367.1 MarR family transcriptional regulator [Actinoplanes humidus]
MSQDLGIVDGLAQLTFLVQGALAKRAAAHDLSMTQVRLLGVLRDRRPGVNQLAALLELDKSSITGLVDRASARGLVTRVPSERDRRAVEVVLTDRGRALAEEVERDFGADVAVLVSGLTDPEQRRLSALASRVIETSPA